jgi:hypothetical protein
MTYVHTTSTRTNHNSHAVAKGRVIFIGEYGLPADVRQNGVESAGSFIDISTHFEHGYNDGQLPGFIHNGPNPASVQYW